MERCNFFCTSCYLSEATNATAPAPFDEIRAQLDELRAYLGPDGKCQITSGEVTLLPVAELGRIVAYALRFGHRECNITVPVVVVHSGRRRRLVEVVRADRAWDRRIMRRALREFVPGIHMDEAHNDPDPAGGAAACFACP